MPIPLLRPDGTLPPGIHDATLDEVLAAFPATTSQRQLLYDALTAFSAAARRMGIADQVVVDGRYVTSKANPSDLDLVILTPGMYQQEGEQRLSAEGVNLALLDVQVAHDAWDFQQWVDFFSTKRDMTPKGTIHLVH